MTLIPVSVTSEVLRNFVYEFSTSLPIFVPNLSFGLDQLSDHGLKLVFELGQLQKEVDEQCLVIRLLNSFHILRILAVIVQHEPPNCDI